MKTKLLTLIAGAGCVGLLFDHAVAQGFDSGSDGSMGALVVDGRFQVTTLNVPSNGVFHFTTVRVGPDIATLRFNRNALNTPIYILATGDVVIDGEGTIDVSGSNGGSTTPGRGGPGAFDGGGPNGFGLGPGGGKPGTLSTDAGGVGSGSYATQGGGGSVNKGSTYGSKLVVPPVGGSGAGGTPDGGGGGGGGAIVIASNTRIIVNSPVGGYGGKGIFAIGGSLGSGGAIRLVAPVVAGTGELNVSGGGNNIGAAGGAGRIRVDTIDRSGLNFNVTGGFGGASWSSGAFMTVLPPNNPRLDITEAAGTTIPEGTNSPVVITLPFGSDTNRTVIVQARNFGDVVPIEVVLTPQLGEAVKVQAQIDNTTVNPATAIVNVAFPQNTPVAVHAWRR